MGGCAVLCSAANGCLHAEGQRDQHTGKHLVQIGSGATLVTECPALTHCKLNCVTRTACSGPQPVASGITVSRHGSTTAALQAAELQGC
jgi:hypothetical protein